MRYNVFLLGLCLFLMSGAFGDSRSDHRATHERRLALLEPLRETHRNQENTGFIFLMSHEGHVVLEDYSGFAILEHGVQIEPESRFPVMSVTKAITGLALSLAATEGLVDLDAPIAEHLSDYEGEGADMITLRQLATHTSGIPHTRHPERRSLYVQHFPDATSSRYVYETRALAFTPGSGYGYSSSGYNLIAATIEAASGQNYKHYVRSRILEPLGLADTDFDDVLAPISKRVRNYSFVDVWAQPWRAADGLQLVPTWDFSYNLGGGNMYSTAGDLLELGEALLAKSSLAPEVWDLATTKPPATADLSAWSMGWIHGEDPWGRRTIHITGATPGVQAALYVYPEEDLVFVALSNCWGKNSAGAELVIGSPQRIVDTYLSLHEAR